MTVLLPTVDLVPITGTDQAIIGDMNEWDSFLLSVKFTSQEEVHQPTLSYDLFFLQTSLPSGWPAAI